MELNSFYFKTIVGMDNRIDDLDLNGERVVLARNCRFQQKPGAAKKRPPLSYYNSTSLSEKGVLGSYRFYSEFGVRQIMTVDNKVYVVSPDGYELIRTLQTTGRRMVFQTYKNLLIASNGYDAIFCYDGSSDYVTWELGACKATVGSGTGITKTDISYKITIDDDAYICDAVSNVLSVTDKSIVLSNIPLGPLGTANRKIYRKDSGTSGQYKLVHTINDNITTEWTDTNATASGASIGTATDEIPKGTILLIHRERLFISGDPEEPNSIFYSDAFLPWFIQRYTASSLLEISKDDGDKITGIDVLMGTLICIKQNNIRKVFVASSSANVDPASWYSEDPLSHIGTPAPYSVTKTPKGIIFLGWDGWYIYDGTSTPKQIIQQFDINSINKSRYADVVAYYNNNTFYATYHDAETSSETFDRVLVFNMNVMEMSIDNINVSSFSSASGVNESNELFLGDSTKGVLYIAEESFTRFTVSDKNQLEGQEMVEDVFISKNKIQLGENVNPTAIPEGLCILWDTVEFGPGPGWDEITTGDGYYIKISTEAALQKTGTGSHSHTFSVTTSTYSGPWIGVEDPEGPERLAASPITHSHSTTLIGTKDFEPYNVKFRIFRKNTVTTEYQFPIGSIIFWDQTNAPVGFIPMNQVYGAGYAKLGTADLGYEIITTHYHVAEGTFNHDVRWVDNRGEGTPYYGVDDYHSFSLDSSYVDGKDVQMKRVEFLFIKKISHSEEPLDGINKYAYCLFDSAVGGDWEDMTTSLNDRYIKSSNAYGTNDTDALTHTHTFTSKSTTEKYSTMAGTNEVPVLPNHSHTVSITSTTDALSIKTITFKIGRKALGKTVVWNAAYETKHVAGALISSVFNTNIDLFEMFYWNTLMPTGSDIKFLMRTGETEVSVSTGVSATCSSSVFTTATPVFANGDLVTVSATSMPGDVHIDMLYTVGDVSSNTFKLYYNGEEVETSSDGSGIKIKKWTPIVVDKSTSVAMSLPQCKYFQYLIVFESTDSRTAMPTIILSNGYFYQFYYKNYGNYAETGVDFIYETGFMNANAPTVDKIFKGIALQHEGYDGDVVVTWATDNATNSFTIPLSKFPKKWSSFFHDKAMGSVVSIRISKNDLNDFLIKEFKITFEEQPIIL